MQSSVRSCSQQLGIPGQEWLPLSVRVRFRVIVSDRFVFDCRCRLITGVRVVCVVRVL